MVVVFHAAFVAFVVFGMVAIVIGLVLGWAWVRNFWFRTLHLSVIAIVTAQTLAGMMCPLTILENNLRRQAGEQSYPGGVHRLSGAPPRSSSMRNPGSSPSQTPCSVWPSPGPSCWDHPAGPGGRSLSRRAPPRCNRPPDRGAIPNENETALWLIASPEGASDVSNRNPCPLAAVRLGRTHVNDSRDVPSPFVKRLDRPEKLLYVFCVDADARDNDFVAVIDVYPDSPSYGTLIHTLISAPGERDPSTGDDYRRPDPDLGGGLLSSRIWIIDVATDPAKPKVETVPDEHPPEDRPLGSAHLLRPAGPDA